MRLFIVFFYKNINAILLTAVLFIFSFFPKNTLSFEAIPQDDKKLFLCPYAGFGFYNSPLADGTYNRHDKIRKMYYGLFTEYGLTDRITIGADVALQQTWTSQNGKVFGKIDDKSFALGSTLIFGRYNFYRTKHLYSSAYMSFNVPSFGSGTGRLDHFKPYNQWANEWRIESGYKFDNGNYITLNLGYKAQYNQPIDMLTFKMTFMVRTLPWDLMMLVYLKKNTYLNKGNSLYYFSKNNSFNIDAFDFFTKNGYVGIDIFLGKRISKGKVIVLAYNQSFHSKILGNKKMNYNYSAVFLEFWWVINFKD